MKLKDLPPPKEGGTHVRLQLKNEQAYLRLGTLFSPYPMPTGKRGVRRNWRVPFLPDGLKGSGMKLYLVGDIERCEVIE